MEMTLLIRGRRALATWRTAAPPAGRRWFSASELLPPSMKSVRVRVAEDVSLHAVVPQQRPTAPASQPPVLCLPSAFGSVIHNFRPQMEALEAAEIEVLGIDPRGYGYSRPPPRDFPVKYFERDAEDLVRALDVLGYDQVSILGWSAGANAGAVLAAKYPDRVARLVMVNGNSFVDLDDVETFDEFEDVTKWHPTALEQAVSIYGAEHLQRGWSEMLAALRAVYDNDGDLYCGSLPLIRCKTLVVAGANDRLVPEFHGEYLSERILHSRLHVVPNGRHDLHLQDPDTFNALLEAFFAEPDDKHTQSREFVSRPLAS